jgi:hypothetical protein
LRAPRPLPPAGRICRRRHAFDPCGMPRADRVSPTAGGLAMPSVDQLSNKGTMNVLLDRAISGLPPDRTVVGLFMNFSRLTDKAPLECDAASPEFVALRLPARRAAHRPLPAGHRPPRELRQRYPPHGVERMGAPGEQDRPGGAGSDRAHLHVDAARPRGWCHRSVSGSNCRALLLFVVSDRSPCRTRRRPGSLPSLPMARSPAAPERLTNRPHRSCRPYR